MTDKLYTVDEIKNIVAPIAKKYKLERAYLFGSYARGDFNKESDVDIRIDKGELKTLFEMCGFYTEVEEALDKNVDILTTGSLSDEFLNDIKKDEILIYGD